MVELHRLRAALDAQDARIGAAWNTRAPWAADGARTGAAWLAVRTRAPRGEYSSLLWLGSRMQSMTHIASAWEAGEITTAQVVHRQQLQIEFAGSVISLLVLKKRSRKEFSLVFR
jgi:hypothetical protein